MCGWRRARKRCQRQQSKKTGWGCSSAKAVECCLKSSIPHHVPSYNSMLSQGSSNYHTNWALFCSNEKILMELHWLRWKSDRIDREDNSKALQRTMLGIIQIHQTMGGDECKNRIRKLWRRDFIRCCFQAARLIPLSQDAISEDSTNTQSRKNKKQRIRKCGNFDLLLGHQIWLDLVN